MTIASTRDFECAARTRQPRFPEMMGKEMQVAMTLTGIRAIGEIDLSIIACITTAGRRGIPGERPLFPRGKA